MSTATVSRVLNEVGPVRPATRRRVLQTIRELNYQPNLHARSLAGGRSRVLGLVVSNIENPFFLDIYHSLEEAARQRGYEVVIASTGYSPARLIASVHQLLARRPAAPGAAGLGDRTDARRRAAEGEGADGVLRRRGDRAVDHHDCRRLPRRHAAHRRLPAEPRPPAHGVHRPPHVARPAQREEVRVRRGHGSQRRPRLQHTVVSA